MSNPPFTPPEFQHSAFNCPFCLAFSNQRWYKTMIYFSGPTNLENTFVCFCEHCEKYSIWQEEMMVYPDFEGVDSPNEDFDVDIIADYKEASSILYKSPRGASALLRLAVQKLCKQLGEPGKDINTDIGSLVKKGLSPTIQQALDALRVIGNDSVHPGQIDLRDDPNTAQALFRLLNKIAETMITEPKQIQEIYDKIPESKKKAIEDRDKLKD